MKDTALLLGALLVVSAVTFPVTFSVMVGDGQPVPLPLASLNVVVLPLLHFTVPDFAVELLVLFPDFPVFPLHPLKLLVTTPVVVLTFPVNLVHVMPVEAAEAGAAAMAEAPRTGRVVAIAATIA